MALQSDGTVWAWGYNGYGQIGDGTTTNRLSPIQLPNFSKVIAVAAGEYHSLALKSDGTVWAWGANGSGNLGNGTTTDASTPIQVNQVANVIAIAAGAGFSLALESNGTVWAWGYGTYGQIGNGSTSDAVNPTQVIDLTEVIAIAAGSAHALALKSDGTVWTWGYNNYGQLGDGTTNSQSTVVSVSRLTGVIAIAGGDNHSLAVKSDGTVWAWGYNNDGQLGNGTYTNSSTPGRVSGLSGALAVAAGTEFSEALTSNGAIWAWGANNAGQFGNNTTSGSVTPLQGPTIGQIYTLSLNTSPSGGGTVTADPPSPDGTYLSGTQVCLTPVPNSGYAFTGWTGTALSDTNCLTVTLRDFPILASSCNIPTTAQAYSLNFTAVPPAPLSFITVWPAGQTQPFVSTLNDLVAEVVANAAIVPAGTNGDIDVLASDNTDLVIDINGYFAPAATGALSFYTATPCRVLDSRQPAGSQPASGELTVNVAGSTCAPPNTAQAYVFNATVVPPGPLAFLSLWPDGEGQPTVSTLNAFDGSITSNMAIVPTSNGSIDVFAYNPTYLILDLAGYFAP